MRVLILGGTRFLGAELASRLVVGGHHVTLLNRGNREGAMGVTSKVERLRADRTSRHELARALDGATFDAAVDMCAYTRADAEGAVEVLRGKVDHYIFVSTGQVYLVREGVGWPAREADYAGPTQPRPTDPVDLEEWVYGMDKRAAEDVLAAAWVAERFPSTCLRLPMVHGLGDYYRRIEGYLWRLLDGGPLLMPDGGHGPARHVGSTAVARTVVGLLGERRAFGRVYNLAWDEALTVREFVTAIARAAGAQPTLIGVPRARLAEANLRDTDVSPFGGAWMSCLDATLAKVELGFRHEPLEPWLTALVSGTLATLPRASARLRGTGA